jgi:dTDP-3-amino-3,4,6-trideoxy-alpha-D-glucose transaminase
MRIPFCDLRAAVAGDAEDIAGVLLNVARSGSYILGEQVAGFEAEWSAYCGAPKAVGVASGTDALALVLRAARIGQGDEVLVPAYTAAATWTAVASTGAVPVGVDADEASGLIDVGAVRAALGPRTAALIAVHLFGRLAPMRELRRLADSAGLLLVEDAAHAHGAAEAGIRVGELGDACAFSFYPTKLLGAFGDAGAITTADEALAARARMLRSYGQGWPPGDAATAGLSSRLDELQAAVLRVRLRRLDEARSRLRELGRRYRDLLEEAPGLGLAPAPADGEPAWHQFTVTHEHRDRLRSELAARGVGTAVHYAPLPPQLSAFGAAGAFPRAERMSRMIVSLPFDAWLTGEQAYEVCSTVVTSCNGIAERSRT